MESLVKERERDFPFSGVERRMDLRLYRIFDPQKGMQAYKDIEESF